MSTTQAAKTDTLKALAVYFERRTLVMLALGFAAGLPNLLVFDTLSAWMREAGVSLQVIGYVSLATLAYALKFLWSPIVDRSSVPVLTALLGHRRSWMLVAQGAIVLGLFAIAGANPGQNIALVACFAGAVAFASATQDIVIDAWRIEAATEERQGAMAAAYQWGYRIAILVAGIAPLMLADRIDWGFAYAAMALLMAIGVAAVLLAPKEAQRPAVEPALPKDMPVKPAPEALEWALRLVLLVFGATIFGSGFTGRSEILQWAFTSLGAPGAAEAIKAAWAAKPFGVFAQFIGVLIGAAMIVAAALPMPGAKTRPGVYFQRSYGEPFADFARRFAGSAALILAMICCYRLSDFVLNIMNPFYLDLGFEKDRIAEIRKGFGVVMMMTGVGLAGWAVARFGLMKPLLVGAFASPLTNLMFAWLATQGPNWQAFALCIAVDNITAGFAGTVFIAYMSSLTSAGFTATQYALFSSLYALPGKLIAAQSGSIIEGSALAAHEGGFSAPLMGLLASLPAGSFAAGAEKLGVAPAALGAGYIAFFSYSCLIGVIAIGLTFEIMRRNARRAKAGEGSARATGAYADPT